MNKIEIIKTCLLIIIALGIIIYYIIKAIKNKWLQKLTTTIESAIVHAETKFPNGHGEEKLQFVLNTVKEKCNELGIPYSLLYKLIQKLVNTIIANYNIISKKKKLNDKK